MSRPVFGIVAGLVFGAIAVALMLPMSFPDKRTALAAAFSSRFAIGLLAATVQLPLPPWARGLLVGFLISLPDALVTKAYAPILIIGSLGGILVALAAARWAA
jgi:hypothetical protein